MAPSLDRIRNVALTWPFATSVTLLLINDFWLKQTWPGLVSGKLSDFAGIAMVTMLLLALLPNHRLRIFTVVAVAFAYWKSPLSQPLIDSLNSWLPAPIGRTVDYLDLVALTVMPVCTVVVTHPVRFAIPGNALRRALLPPLFLAATFGLMATSKLSMPRQIDDFQFRLESPTAVLDRERIAKAVQSLAAGQDMRCRSCRRRNIGAVYTRQNVLMAYNFASARVIDFHVDVKSGFDATGAAPRKKTEELLGELKARLTAIHPDIRYIERQ
jgi:hypothetical protein